MTAVTAVIGNYEGAALLPDCLRSLRDQTQRPVETIVVDASSQRSEHGRRRRARLQGHRPS